MARKSKADRINEILLANPLLKRDDSRIEDLIFAEGQLRKAQRVARSAEVLSASAAGTAKRHPSLIVLEHAEKSVRRLRNDLQIDRLGVKRNESAGVKVKRSNKAEEVLALYGPEYAEHSLLIPGLAALLAAHGLVAGDLPEVHQKRFRADLEAQSHLIAGIRERIKA